jgi:regulator of protease activity HflC (stomatin/prohibitin superfamily)
MRPRGGAELLLILLASLMCAGCAATSGTEIGVRTTMLGLLERRGDQQVYEPGGVYLVMPVVNAWNVLPVSQQNLIMNENPNEGDRPVPDDIPFKTKDGNNVHIDVNVMWRVNPKEAGFLVKHVGSEIDAIKERVVRPISRSVIRDVFNEITSEDYYHVTIKNEIAAKTKARLEQELTPYGILIDMLQVQQHRFDKAYQDAIDAQRQAEADVRTLVEQQKAVEELKKNELEAKRAEWNKRIEDARGQAGSKRNDADGYYQKKTNEAKAVIAVAQAEAEGVRKAGEALGKLGGDAYVKMEVAKQFAGKRIWLVPASSVSTMNVNQMVDYLVGQGGGAAPSPPPAAP